MVKPKYKPFVADKEEILARELIRKRMVARRKIERLLDLKALQKEIGE